MKLILILLFIIICSCERYETIPPDKCLTCITTISENHVIIEKHDLYVCGEELVKRQKLNMDYIDEYTGNLISIRTICFVEPCKDE